MSYNIYLREPVGGETIKFDHDHDIHGGTFKMGGNDEAWLNVTYNYSVHFQRIGEKGIRTIYGMTGAASLPLLRVAAEDLGDDLSSDYWAAMEGNAKQALHGLIAFAEIRPDGIWAGD